MIRQIGQITNTTILARQLSQKIASSFQEFNSCLNIPTAYFIWRNPYLSIGQDTFIHQMLEFCGLQNVFANQQRYPEISKTQLQAAQPKLILLSSEPYPFREKHLLEFQQICPGALVKLVDGELFSWYGSRLLHSAVYFNKLIKEIQIELA
jgi:ABC-type Fe3+-hydroxamate transport system substrate-binding protein